MTASAARTPDDLLRLAEVALHEGRPDTTLELCRELLETAPEHPGALFLAAEAHRDLREAPEAEARYRLLLDRDPDRPDAWAGLGATLFDQCFFDDAERCFRRALRLAPGTVEALYGRALVRERRGDHRGARRDYLRAWRLSTQHRVPTPLRDEEVRRLLVEAVDGMDEGVQAWVASTPILVQEVPEASVCDAYDPPASPAELLGHLTASMHDDPKGGLRWSSFPPAILLYRRNLARWADDRDQLAQALRESVLAHASEWLRTPHHEA